MRRFTYASLVSVMVFYQLSIAEDSGRPVKGCFEVLEVDCYYCITANGAPFPLKTCKDCGCDGSHQPSVSSPVFCVCEANVKLRDGKLYLARSCTRPNAKNNGCKDGYELLTKADGTLDDVLCASYQACEEQCQAVYIEAPNGEPYHAGNKCLVDDKAPLRGWRCNQYRLVGEGC